MADATAVSTYTPPPSAATENDCGLSIPPLDAAFFSQQLYDDFAQGDNSNDVVVDDLDFDFSFDDIYLPSAEELDDLLNPTEVQQFDCEPGQGPNLCQFASFPDQFDAAFKSTYSELHRTVGDADFSGDRSSNGSGVLSSSSPGMGSAHISGYLNVPSPESNGSNRGSSGNCGGEAKVLNCPSPESQGSENFRSDVSEDSKNSASRSVSSSVNPINSSVRSGVVNQRIKLEEASKKNVNRSMLKRKKECEDLPNTTLDSSVSKHKKPSCNSENTEKNNNDGELSPEDEKRNARLMRNRESAQLSRQRKKHYVEELEDKVKMMHSTIQDLNSKISYFMAENATLRQQMGGAAAVPPPSMAPPPPGMYPHPAMMYPWMPCAPPYMMKPQGSQVPLVPIPRLKPQQPAQAPKVSKKSEVKKNESPKTKTKKVASVSFIGLLFFIFLFGGLAPMINMRYGGVRETLTGGDSYYRGGPYERHHERVLMVNGAENGDKLNNASVPLVASLYVPRNDKLVKIDGNLIIHSVLASEEATSSHGEEGSETGLAVRGDLSPAVPIPGMQGAMPPHHLRALGSGRDEDSMKSKANDGRLHQWFQEGLAGPMLRSGMCSEVFQFDISASASGAIAPATTPTNISENHKQNSTRLTKGGHRRILRGLPIPLPDSSHNISRQHKGRNSKNESLNRNNSLPPMVVSVLVDPREAGDADIDGMMGKKSLSRIFVVVLIDSVKYVTYSCMLPFKGSTPHLVTT